MDKNETVEPTTEPDRPQTVRNAAELKVVLTEFIDGYGEIHTRVAFVLPWGEIRLLDEKTTSKPASSWLAEGIKNKLKHKKG